MKTPQEGGPPEEKGLLFFIRLQLLTAAVNRKTHENEHIECISSKIIHLESAYGGVISCRFMISLLSSYAEFIMQNIRRITDDVFYVGASDRRLALFENVYPIERGVSYNSYIVLDEKTVLLDTVDHSVSREFLENVEAALAGRALDYLVVNHMEPDHCSVIAELVLRYPGVKIVGNQKTVQMIKQFYSFDVDSRAYIVKDGDTLSTGKHSFTFVFAPMVHWPEVMVAFDSATGILFSADAFGTFGALSGNLYADEVEFEREWLDDARRYYINIVGKYGVQVTNTLKKAATLPIKMICPLHGPIWRENLGWFIGKYSTWAG